MASSRKSVQSGKKTHGDGRRKSSSLPTETVEYLKAWMMSDAHVAHPYPTDQEKIEIMKDTGIELKQLTNWFVNNRKRYWKPRVEARLQQQAQAAQAAVQAHAAAVAAVSAVQLQKEKKSQAVVMPSNDISGTSGIETGSGLISPNLRFKSKLIQSTKTLPNFKSNDASIADASTLAFAAQMIEQDQESSAPVSSSLSSSTYLVSTGNGGLLTPVSSVAVSEGEMSDASGNQESLLSSRSETANKLSNASKTNPDVTNQEPVSAFPTNQPEESSPKALKTRCVSYSSLEMLSSVTFPVVTQENERTTGEVDNLNKKRVLEGVASNPVSLTRKRYRTVSIDMWKDACRNASHVNDEGLPSLEEATRLFGYTDS